MASIQKRPAGNYRARYRDPSGKEHARHFDTRRDAQSWLDSETSKLVTGQWTDPGNARITVGAWCGTWLAGYAAGRRPGTVATAAGHVKVIVARFGAMPLGAVKPSHVKAWLAELNAAGLSQSYVSGLHTRMAQIMGDAVHDSLIPRSPCSRRTSPPRGRQRAYVATTEQVWALHDAMPARYRAAVLLGAFAGLRAGEVCGLRPADVDCLRGMITPAVQHGGAPLKTVGSQAGIPVPREMTDQLAAHMARWPAGTVLTGERLGRPMTPAYLEKHVRAARGAVPGLPDGFRFHDLRHYFASLLIAHGHDVKTVQARLRHASATTTLDVYGHLWPDRDDSTRATVAAMFTGRHVA